MIRNLSDFAGFRTTNMPTLGSGDFTILIVARHAIEGFGTNNRLVRFVVNAGSNPQIAILWNRNSRLLDLRYRSAAGVNRNITVNPEAGGGAWPFGTNNSLALIASSYNASAQQHTGIIRCEGMPIAESAVSVSGGTFNLAGLDECLIFGGVDGAQQAFKGDLAVCVVKRQLSVSEFNTVYDAMINGSLSRMLEAVRALQEPEWHMGFYHTSSVGAVPGAALTSGMVEGRIAAAGSERAVFTVPGLQGSLTVESPFESPLSAMLLNQRAQPSIPAVTVDRIAGPAINLRAWALSLEGPTDPIRRIAAWSNSRGATGSDGSSLGTGNHAEGMRLAAGNARCAGVDCESATDNDTAPRFMFRQVGDAPPSSGTILNVSTTGSFNYRDFSRFWTRSSSAGSTGPGAGRLLRASASLSQLASKPAGSMASTDDPLVTRAYLLEFPGAGEATVTPQRGASNAGATDYGTPQVVDLDTEEIAHTFSSVDDAYDAGSRTLTLQMAEPVGFDFGRDNLCVFIASGTGADSIAQIESVSHSLSGLDIVLRHPFRTGPANGSVLSIGEFNVVKVDTEHAPSADARWGHRVSAAGGPVMFFASGAWNPEALGGYVYAPMGWGGNGYTPQLAQTSEVSVRQMIEALELDAVVLHPATQNSSPSDLETVTAIIRNAGVQEVAWVYEGPYETTFAAWAEYMQNNAEANGVPAVLLTAHPGVGTVQERYTDFGMQDSAHNSVRGAEKMALAILELGGSGAFQEFTPPAPPPPAPPPGAPPVGGLTLLSVEGTGSWAPLHAGRLIARATLMTSADNTEPVQLRVDGAEAIGAVPPGASVPLGPGVDLSRIDVNAAMGDSALVVATTGHSSARRR